MSMKHLLIGAVGSISIFSAGQMSASPAQPVEESAFSQQIKKENKKPSRATVKRKKQAAEKSRIAKLEARIKELEKKAK